MNSINNIVKAFFRKTYCDIKSTFLRITFLQ